MSEEDCGNCDYQGGIDPQGRVECRVDGLWHPRGQRCEDFKDYVQSKNESERVIQAVEKRRERNEQREREFAEKMVQRDREHATALQHERMRFDKRLWMASWWWQIGLVIISALVGFGLGRLIK
jgi:hypothetical protein